jgi:hypothetical protein
VILIGIEQLTIDDVKRTFFICFLFICATKTIHNWKKRLITNSIRAPGLFACGKNKPIIGPDKTPNNDKY